MVRIHPDPPTNDGAVAQLGEHLLCKQGVVGSIPISSTSFSGQRSAVGSQQRQRYRLRAIQRSAIGNQHQ
jgi:hypothetical protein